MDLKQAKITLEKINALYKNISIDEDSISPIERDLMLSYIRHLYEAFLQDMPATAAPRKKAASVRKKTTPPAPKVEPAPEPVVEVARPKPVVIELPDSIKEYAKPAPKTETVKVVEVEKPVAPAPEPKVEVAPVAPTPKPVSNSDHDVLFEHKEAKELSERLSQAPIKDLKKALGLNDKILIINELFGGDHHTFDTSMHYLNGFASFEEAKVYMSENLADKFNWSAKSRKKRAQDFIKLVRRRYK